MATSASTVAFFGPQGTFTEEALLTQPDLAAAELRAKPAISDVLEAVASGEVDLGFVPLENAIEGTVNATLDGLVFDHELRITREVVLDIHLNLLAPRGTALDAITEVYSYPHALAQCRAFLARHLPGAEAIAANSTADAARMVGKDRKPGTAAIAPRLAGELYNLELLAEAIEDHRENQTRFVAVSRTLIPAPTGHDRTSIVCFQAADRPGNLHGILGQFAARNLNLTKLESRPTKQGLGDYCFIIELDGHIGDEVVGDCIAALATNLAAVKFLGSYPIAGDAAVAQRAALGEDRALANAWLASLRGDIAH